VTVAPIGKSPALLVEWRARLVEWRARLVELPALLVELPASISPGPPRPRGWLAGQPG
jgi:hypothetical protein